MSVTRRRTTCLLRGVDPGSDLSAETEPVSGLFPATTGFRLMVSVRDGLSRDILEFL